MTKAGRKRIGAIRLCRKGAEKGEKGAEKGGDAMKRRIKGKYCRRREHCCLG
jgi:hypothetical protein